MRILRNCSIKTKLNTLAVLTITAALSIGCATFLYSDIQALKAAKQRQIDALARVLGANSISAIEFNDNVSAAETLKSLNHQPSVIAAAVYDGHGKLFATYPGENEALLPQEPPAVGVTLNGEYLEVVRPIRVAARTPLAPIADLEALMRDHQSEMAIRPTETLSLETGASEVASEKIVQLGTILVRSSTKDITQQTTMLLLLTTATFTISVAVGLALAQFIQRSITVPVNDLVHASRQVAQSKDFGDRAKKHGDDELGVLCDAFNKMLDELQSNRQQLQEAHDDLERRVIERTAELDRSMQEAQKASRAKSDFLANMSHEIRTPMTAILGFADLLYEEPATSAESRERINTIQRNGRHLLEIVNDILDVSKIEAGKMTVESIDCSIFELLADLMSMLRARATEKGLDLELQYEGEIPSVIQTDPTRLRQILVNLIGNAIKFTERGYVKLVVSMVKSLETAEPLMQFQVFDTGVGLTEEQVKSIFQAFTQADETMTRRFGGTGLGLTICQGLSRLLGGGIEVASSAGIGSQFTCTIDPGSLTSVPMMAGSSETIAGKLASDRQKAVLERKPRRIRGRVLLVEDGIDNQRLISLILRKAGAKVTIAENGEIGRDLAYEAWNSDEPYDLIFMDMQMPILDGYAATAALRQLGYDKPIVALTAHAMSDERDKCILAGCDDYCTKPVDRTALIRLADQWIAKKHSTRGIAADAGAKLPSTPAGPEAVATADSTAPLQTR